MNRRQPHTDLQVRTVSDLGNNANQHARRDVRQSGRWTCLCDDCRSQRAIDDADGTPTEQLDRMLRR